MAFCLTPRHRGLALLVRSYRKAFQQNYKIDNG